MESYFKLDLLEKDQLFEERKKIMSFSKRDGRAQAIFREVEKEFSENRVSENPENQPFLYVRCIPVREEGSNVLPTGSLNAFFEAKVESEMIDFINRIR